MTQVPGLNLLTSVLKGLTGIVIIFALFRKHAPQFSNEKKIGRILQFVGRRTLDIYLLHYFVLPYGITIPDFLIGTDLMQMVTFATLAILVIGVCLIISQVLRLHPAMAHYLFGAKKS